MMFARIILTEDDVLGAKLHHTSVNENSLVQLKRWLQYRGLKTSNRMLFLIHS